eukprot:scaffold46238_cov270-Isochrysis_galbana.AAC.1
MARTLSFWLEALSRTSSSYGALCGLGISPHLPCARAPCIANMAQTPSRSTRRDVCIFRYWSNPFGMMSAYFGAWHGGGLLAWSTRWVLSWTFRFYEAGLAHRAVVSLRAGHPDRSER